MELKIKYRPDIDGLRAIAVLSVVFYHAGIKIFSGGFVGVDVFFVISGFLITKLIIQEVYSGQFSLTNFYERRIRRIFPALFMTIVLTTAIGTYLFDSNVFFEFSKSLLAMTFFTSNILFWTEIGYFDAPSYLKPLLHTWSLAVEEQFYIFFPLLILIIFRFFKNKLKLTLIITAILSFIISVYFVQKEPSTAFYLAPLRAWELLIGSLLTVNIIPAKIKPEYHNLLGIAGITMILFSVFTYTDNTTFPGISAALPVFGAALIIYSGIEGNTFTTQFLGAQPFTFIGQISYSLYLLHWPMIVFGRYYLIRKATPADITTWLLVILLLSTLSWKFAENPFRSKAFLNKITIFKLAGINMLLVTLVGIFIYFNDGLPGRFKEQTLNAVNISDPGTKWGKCERKFDNTSDLINLCHIGANTGKVNFLVWGDSHAEAIAPSINKSAKEQMVGGLIVFNYGCPPLLGINLLNMDYCYGHNMEILGYINNHPDIKTIVLIARWAVYTNKDINNVLLFDRGLNNTVNELTKLNRDIVIVTQVPEIGYYVPSAYSIAVRTNRDLNKILAPTLQEYQLRNNSVLNTIYSIEQQHENLYIVDMAKALCTDKCLVTLDNVPLYRDDNHLSSYGSHYVSYIFDPLFIKISKSNNP